MLLWRDSDTTTDVRLSLSIKDKDGNSKEGRNLTLPFLSFPSYSDRDIEPQFFSVTTPLKISVGDIITALFDSNSHMISAFTEDDVIVHAWALPFSERDFLTTLFIVENEK